MGAKRRLNGTSKVNRRTDRQTDGLTFRLIESIGPEGRCFEKVLQTHFQLKYAFVGHNLRNCCLVTEMFFVYNFKCYEDTCSYKHGRDTWLTECLVRRTGVMGEGVLGVSGFNHRNMKDLACCHVMMWHHWVMMAVRAWLGCFLSRF